MSTEFQKDLYKKSGSLLTVWDICIGVGLITLGSGVYMHHKEKKGSASKLSAKDAEYKKELEDAERQEFLKRKEEKEKQYSRQKEERYQKQITDQKRRIKAERQMEDKIEKRSTKKDKGALSKLGL